MRKNPTLVEKFLKIACDNMTDHIPTLSRGAVVDIYTTYIRYLEIIINKVCLYKLFVILPINEFFYVAKSLQILQNQCKFSIIASFQAFLYVKLILAKIVKN